MLAALAAGGPVARAQYGFTLVADSGTPGFIGFNTVGPAINEQGSVAFLASITPTSNGIFTGNGSGAPTALALSSDTTFSGFGAPALNDLGAVVFYANLDAGGTGIFTRGPGGFAETIARSSEPVFASFGTAPSINATGRVAFAAGPDGGGGGIYTSLNGTTTTVALTTGPKFDNLFDPAINAAGTTAFFAVLKNGNPGVFTGGGGGTSDVATRDGYFEELGTPSINNQGTVAFFAILNSDSDAGIFAINGTERITIALRSGAFEILGNPSINADGDVAFFATLDAGGSGIYVSDGNAIRRVIGTGDFLNGSTVTTINASSVGNSLNDAGQVAFYYELANGMTGIALATPVPEPAGVMLVVCGGVVLLARRTRGGRTSR